MMGDRDNIGYFSELSNETESLLPMEMGNKLF